MTTVESTIRRILGYARRIAVVGLSSKPWRESHGVAASLQARGYTIVPVNPHEAEVLGERAYPRLADVPGDIDLVDVFRRAEHLPDLVEEAAAIGARGFWGQLGIRSPEARRRADVAGLDYVDDLCLKVEVQRLADQLPLPPQR